MLSYGRVDLLGIDSAIWNWINVGPSCCSQVFVDRLTFGGNIIETGTRSFRLAHAKAQLAAS